MRITIEMSDFFKKLEKYIKNMEKNYPIELAPHFKYDETTIISPDVANELYGIYAQLSITQQLWEKEKDYARLLKKENVELRDELDYLYSDEDNDEEDTNSNSNENKDKEYIC